MKFWKKIENECNKFTYITSYKCDDLDLEISEYIKKMLKDIINIHYLKIKESMKNGYTNKKKIIYNVIMNNMLIDFRKSKRKEKSMKSYY
jgi:hypothetical protein